MSFYIPFGVARKIIAGTEFDRPKSRYVTIEDSRPDLSNPYSDTWVVRCVDITCVAPWRHWLWIHVISRIPPGLRRHLVRWVLV